jgi:RimJ/RimL family protein N-acetyltransferase
MQNNTSNKKLSEIVAVPYDARFLEYSWNWLHNEEIRFLTMSPVITKEQQLAWFKSLNKRHDYLIWGIEVNKIPAGAFGIKNFDAVNGEYWGYIGEKSFWGKGIGNWMIGQAIARARELGTKRLYLKVLQANSRAVGLYTRHNFVTYLIENDILWMERAI